MRASTPTSRTNGAQYHTPLQITDKKESTKGNCKHNNHKLQHNNYLKINNYNVYLNVLLETFYGVRCDLCTSRSRIFVDDVLSKKVKPSGMGRAQKSFSMDSITIISQRNWTQMQLAPRQNSSVDLLVFKFFLPDGLTATITHGA